MDLEVLNVSELLPDGQSNITIYSQKIIVCISEHKVQQIKQSTLLDSFSVPHIVQGF